ncbi:MAG: HEAT repeat domain-containing protein [Robiginitomaculum sp.]|nr:HEAT repeat domain-containing protein [Robiginitomaculum sp.]
MALIKKRELNSGKNVNRLYERDWDGLIKQLEDDDPVERRWAVRDLVKFPESVGPLCELLKREGDHLVQDLALDTLMQIGGSEAVSAMVPLLRSDDARLRNGVIEALQGMPEDVALVMNDLLTDEDSDVRIFAADILRILPHKNTVKWLCDALEKEEHPNVVGAIVDRLSEVGDEGCVPVLKSSIEKFQDNQYLSFAINTAIKMSS